jgi:hypothetical protein
MTTVSSPAVLSGIMAARLKAGSALSRSTKYTAESALAANDIIEMIKVPKGARIMRIDYKFSAFGAGRTLDIGISTDVDKYVDGDDVSAAGSDSVILDEILSADTTIQAKVLGDTMPADATLSMHVYYKMADAIADEA